MGDFVTVYKYMKWDGTKYVMKGWATEAAIKMYQAFKITGQFQLVELSQLDEDERLIEI